MNLVRTTYKPEDVTILLQDLSGKMRAMDTEEREKAIQSGVHYSEMLPLEYKPTDDYIKIYDKALSKMSQPIAYYVGKLADRMYNQFGDKLVIISLARAGIPAGILVKRYIKQFFNADVPHYSISIIRGKGIDEAAMDYIYEQEHTKGVENFVFLDGWTGKGAIMYVLQKAVDQLKEKDAHKWSKLSSDLAVIADPANICNLRGTHGDVLIPSSCLNATVSGLVSRTIHRDDLIENGEFHGAVYFEHLESEDRSYEFINTIEKYFKPVSKWVGNVDDYLAMGNRVAGIEVVKHLAEVYDIEDINMIKPGIGEATRVLLRRVPWKVVINESCKNNTDLDHIVELCKERNVPIEYRNDIGYYSVCGIIKNMSADA